MGLRPTQVDENGMERCGSPRIYTGKERFSAPRKLGIPIVRFSAGMANSRAKQAAEKRAEATSEAQEDV